MYEAELKFLEGCVSVCVWGGGPYKKIPYAGGGGRNGYFLEPHIFAKKEL